MVNGPDDVYVERKGRLEKVTDGLFEGEEAVLHVMGWGGGGRGCAGTRTRAAARSHSASPGGAAVQEPGQGLGLPGLRTCRSVRLGS
jgi:hypothetical protein